MILDHLNAPIVLAPLAGGPSTPALAAAVTEAGGLGFIAAGYLSADELAARIEQGRALTTGPLGVNLFVPGTSTADPAAVAAYARIVERAAGIAGATAGTPRFDDDAWAAKLDVVIAARVPVVSFTFGCPDPDVVERVHAAGAEVWVTVTRPAEAQQAAAAGADVLVVQGTEAGGHRGGFTDDPAEDLVDGLGLLALLQLVQARTALPLVAAGGIMTGAAIAATLAAGARAAQLGTAFLRCPEAGTSPVQREAVAQDTPTAPTRAFTGRTARGIRNRFMDEHHAEAPAGYPELHYLTAPLRAAGRAAGDADLVNLWAGQAHVLARELPAGELVRALAEETRDALRRAAERLS